VIKRVEVVTVGEEARVERSIRVVVGADRKARAVCTHGRGIVWMVNWQLPDPLPVVEYMTPEDRDEVAASLAMALQRMKDQPIHGGFTPRDGPSQVREASFDD
jgi:hypothetical protein